MLRNLRCTCAVAALSATAAFTFNCGLALAQSGPTMDHSGPHIGLSFGGAIVDQDVQTSYPATNTLTYSTTVGDDPSLAPYGAIELGYSADFGDFILGVEGDFGLMASEDVFTAKGSYDIDSDWLATLRGKAGLDLGEAIPYVTGGAAWMHSEIKPTSGQDALIGSDEVLTGYVVGGGVDIPVDGGFLITLEYLYGDFDGANASVTDNIIIGDTENISTDPTLHLLKVGITKEF